MSINIIEIKARCADPDRIHTILGDMEARFVGEDRQIDTYFNTLSGRLKLRQGNIESKLIQYLRPDQAGPKHSQVLLYKPSDEEKLKQVLKHSVGVKVVVDKIRSIYFSDNVKIHIDQVKELGSFLEIEAIDEDGSIGMPKLNEQCNSFMDLFGVKKEDLLDVSYSDLLLEKNGSEK